VSSATKKIRVGLLGLGYWGPNLARNFAGLPGAELAYLCDLSPELRSKYAAQFPQATFTDRYEDLLEYHPGVLHVRDMVQSGELGDMLDAYSHRLNLGQFRRDENALWSLGVHDVATLMFLIGEAPVEVSARGESYLNEGVEDVVFGNMKFANGVLAHIHLSWLDPHKIRKLTVVGSKKMVTFDDMETDRKVTVYDKGFSVEEQQLGSGSWGEYISKREGDIYMPRMPAAEPLRIECQHFVDAIVNDTTPRSDGWDGVRVVQVLEGMQRSLEQGGAPMSLEPAAAG
jgi:predicted dehydrogenase